MTLKSAIAGLMLVAALLVVVAPGVASAEDNSANTVAICGCGKVFTPDAKTEYIEFEGKSYACCTHECHEMAGKNPEAAAKMAKAAAADAMSKLTHTEMAVGNVIAVTETGTEALCGCGMKFKVTDKTKYIHSHGRSYACCTDECHKMASKDPDAVVKMINEKMAKK